VRRSRRDGGRLDEPQLAQVALGLLEDVLVEGIARLEEEELANDLDMRLDVDEVGGPVKPALGCLFRREDVEALDVDFADTGRLFGPGAARAARGQGGEPQGDERPADYVPSSQELM
jgi:hypothetical protein